MRLSGVPGHLRWAGSEGGRSASVRAGLTRRFPRMGAPGPASPTSGTLTLPLAPGIPSCPWEAGSAG